VTGTTACDADDAAGQRETNPNVLRPGMIRRLSRRSGAHGQISWPAAPSLLDYYVQQLGIVFAALGRVFSAEELKRVRDIMEKKLALGFQESPFSKVVIDFFTEAPPNTALTYTVSHRVVTISDEYAEWVENRKPPLFGAHADAKVLHLAQSLGAPSEVTVLDVGAGTGRNTLPLALAGYQTDAVELAPALAAVLRETVATANATVRVFEGDALDPELPIPTGHYRLVVLAEVVASHFRSPAQIRQLLERAHEWLAPGGLLLFSAFLTSSGYKPEPLARELSEVMWCCIFTRSDLEGAAAGLPFSRISDESVYAFEHEHLDADKWPPTGWFPDWTRGLDLFDVAAEKSPVELRWLVYRKNE
jgi:SAM-dependent methyltransferase